MSNGVAVQEIRGGDRKEAKSKVKICLEKGPQGKHRVIYHFKGSGPDPKTERAEGGRRRGKYNLQASYLSISILRKQQSTLNTGVQHGLVAREPAVSFERSKTNRLQLLPNGPVRVHNYQSHVRVNREVWSNLTRS